MPPPDVVRALGPPGFRWAAAVPPTACRPSSASPRTTARPDNRVSLSEGRTDSAGLPVTTVTHYYGEADRRRRDRLLAIARRVLRKAGGLVGKVRLIDSFSHAVGTVRFGRSPQASVSGSDCRMWGVPNLYVVDGSFMPTSGGVNPSLTITANALRVAAHIVGQCRKVTGDGVESSPVVAVSHDTNTVVSDS